jgi:hypothetical protein
MADPRKMGWDYGDGALNDPKVCFKRKNRWVFKIPNVSAQGSPCLPPFKGGRPGLTFKEMDAQHLNETIYFPSKPDWKPINLSLYEKNKIECFFFRILFILNYLTRKRNHFVLEMIILIK